MSDADEWPFPDFGPLPSRTAAEIISMTPTPGGVQVVLFIPLPEPQPPAAA